MKDKSSVLALASLIGTIIGAGVFGIPYVMAKSGIVFCLFYFLILGTVVLILHLFFGEIILRTKQKYRLIGYTEKYLGKKAKILVSFSTILGTIGSLLVYIILINNFLKIILPEYINPLYVSLILLAVLSFFVFSGIKRISRVQFLMNMCFFGAIFLLFFNALPKIDINNFILIDSENIFLPYGVILFSLVGWNAIPGVEKILFKKKNLRKVIFQAMAICICFYFFFGLFISGVTGGETSQDAFQGLVPFLGQKAMILGAIFGLFAVSTSFLTSANYLKNTLIFDYKIPSLISFNLVIFVPLILFLIGFRQFIWVVAFIGTFMGLVDGTVISLIYKKAKKYGDRIPEYNLNVPKCLFYSTMTILFFGAFIEIINYFI
jgi:amino acid permease